MSRTAYIVDGVRTPIGRYGGVLAEVRPDDLAAHTIRTLLARHPGLDPERIDDVLLGDRKSTRLNSSHVRISYAVFCLKKKKKHKNKLPLKKKKKKNNIKQ